MLNHYTMKNRAHFVIFYFMFEFLNSLSLFQNKKTYISVSISLFIDTSFVGASSP